VPRLHHVFILCYKIVVRAQRKIMAAQSTPDISRGATCRPFSPARRLWSCCDRRFESRFGQHRWAFAYCPQCGLLRLTSSFHTSNMNLVRAAGRKLSAEIKIRHPTVGLGVNETVGSIPTRPSYMNFVGASVRKLSTPLHYLALVPSH
jgi:hypothetical protein